MLSMPKDNSRFEQYLQALQDKLGSRTASCCRWARTCTSCSGRKTSAGSSSATAAMPSATGTRTGSCTPIYVRDTEEAMTEVYPKLMAPDTEWQVYREYTCPQCGTLHDVEAPTPWYPVIHDFEPDIDAFYKDWVKLPPPARSN
jgi:acetone carboxylase gamma subunit